MRKCCLYIFLIFLLSHCSDSSPDEIYQDETAGIPKVSSSAIQFSNSNQQQQKFPDGIQDIQLQNTREKNRSKDPVPDQTGGSIDLRRSHPDSLTIRKLNYLRSQNIEIDLNEPNSREYLFSTSGYTRFPSLITLSREKFLKISFDNDLFDNTDRFYTNGVRFDLIVPSLSRFLLSKLMIPYWSSGTNYYGISLVQNLYTPSKTKLGGILYGDRPYAAYLYLGTFKITNDKEKNFRQTSELDLGVIGPLSGGELIQKSFHLYIPYNNEPLGWEYQVQNDVVLNYNLLYEKGIIRSKNTELILHGSGSLGTLYTNVLGGLHLRAGKFNPYFANLGLSKRSLNKVNGLHDIQFYLFLKADGKLVGYDATLQGGLFNKTSQYLISSNSISRITFTGSGGFTFVYGGIRVDLEQFLLSPEMHSGWWHYWMHIGLTFCL